jgi:hypothetical protein
MNKSLATLALAALFVPAMFTGAAPARAAQTNAPFHPFLLPPNRTAATAGKQTLALIYSPIYAGSLLSVGVASVTNPNTGIFCVAPKKPIYAGNAPSVSVEWGSSLGSSIEAFLEYGQNDCPSGNIEVRTFDFSSGTATASENVAFIVTSP